MAYATLEQRRDARETVSHPGKFEGESPMTPILYDISIDGGADEYAGDCQTSGLAERIGKWIMFTTTDGFVSARRFSTVAEAEAAIEAFRDEIGEYESDDPDSTEAFSADDDRAYSRTRED